MPTFTLAVSLRLDAVPDDDVLDALAGLRPGDDELLVWRDGDGAIRPSTDCSAADLEAAVAVGLELGDDALGHCPGAIEEVVAMDDDRQLVWRAEP
jgi:hypothetical protein